jgi:hypothetical protein
VTIETAKVRKNKGSGIERSVGVKGSGDVDCAGLEGNVDGRTKRNGGGESGSVRDDGRGSKVFTSLGLMAKRRKVGSTTFGARSESGGLRRGNTRLNTGIHHKKTEDKGKTDQSLESGKSEENAGSYLKKIEKREAIQYMLESQGGDGRRTFQGRGEQQQIERCTDRHGKERETWKEKNRRDEGQTFDEG